MNWSISVQPVVVCACLAVGLLFDPLGFLRMALFCSVWHEMGHILVYWGITGRFPPIQFHVGGISLKETHCISTKQENWVLLAGPLANMILSAALYGYTYYQASYGVYFLACVSLCTGVYNLLPVGVLDGARLLQNCFPAHRQEAVIRVERIFF